MEVTGKCPCHDALSHSCWEAIMTASGRCCNKRLKMSGTRDLRVLTIFRELYLSLNRQAISLVEPATQINLPTSVRAKWHRYRQMYFKYVATHRTRACRHRTPLPPLPSPVLKAVSKRTKAQMFQTNGPFFNRSTSVFYQSLSLSISICL